MQITSVFLDPNALDEEDILIGLPESPLAAPATAPMIADAGPPQNVVTFTGDNS